MSAANSTQGVGISASLVSPELRRYRPLKAPIFDDLADGRVTLSVGVTEQLAGASEFILDGPFALLNVFTNDSGVKPCKVNMSRPMGPKFESVAM